MEAVGVGGGQGGHWHTLALFIKIIFIQISNNSQGVSRVSKEVKLHEKFESACMILFNQIEKKVGKTAKICKKHTVFSFVNLFSNLVDYWCNNYKYQNFSCNFPCLKTPA